jgi:hypothetical protein
MRSQIERRVATTARPSHSAASAHTLVMFLSCQLRGRSSIVHGRARRASRTIRRIKTMLAGCESVRKNPENRTAWQINEKLPLVAVARQESSASSAILGNPIPLFR